MLEKVIGLCVVFHDASDTIVSDVPSSYSISIFRSIFGAPYDPTNFV